MPHRPEATVRVAVLAIVLAFAALGFPTASASLSITEFVASSDGALLDLDGDDSDWIEITNIGTATTSTAGLYLTDDASERTQWALPAVTLPPAGTLVVFASGKDRADPAAELHTNFSLSSSGEYLALIASDGTTPLSEFDEYPPQFYGTAYGTGFTDADLEPATFAPVASPATWWVPDSDIGDLWQLPGFDDSAWNASLTGIGYGYDAIPGLVGAGGDTESAMRSINASVYLRVPFQIDAPADVVSMTLQAFCEDGFVAYLNGQRIASFSAPDPLTHTSKATDGTEVEPGEPPLEFPIDVGGHLLTGENILAIQAMNSRTSSGDFAMLPALVGQAPASGVTRGAGYLASATPGAPNSRIEHSDFVRDTAFDVARGFYESPFDVSITCATPGATIIYTTDGSIPTLDNGTQVPAADASSPGEATVTITTTTPLRATAFKAGLRPANVDTQTYLFLDDVVVQPTRPPGYPLPWRERDGDTIGGNYDMSTHVVDAIYSREELKNALRDLPTISVVTDIDNLFDRDRGIQVNPRDDGPESERPVSVEFIGFDVSPDLQLDAGMRINGNASRNPNRPKHNFRLTFRRVYGAGRLEFPLFGNAVRTDRFNQIVVRGGNGNSWIHHSSTVYNNAMYIRDQWFRDSLSAMGHPEVLQREAHVYFNGLYWGMHHIFERIEAEWAAERFGGDEDDWEGFRIVGTNDTEIIAGTPAEEAAGRLDSWEALRDAAKDRDLVTVEQYLDLDHFIDYILLNFYGGNSDWDKNNVRAMRRVDPPGKFQFFCHDTERAGLAALNNPGINIDVTGKDNGRGPTGIHTDLARAPDYAIRFADRAYKHLFGDGALTPEKGAARWAARADGIREALKAESARWGDFRGLPPRTLDDWQDALDREYERWFPFRTDVTIDQLRDAGLYPDVDPPGFDHPGGLVSQGHALGISGSSPDIYFTRDGSDPRLPGGAISPSAIRLDTATITIDATQSISARSYDGGTWSALADASFIIAIPASAGDLVIAELLYNPDGDDDGNEFIELLNISDQTLRLGSVAFTDGIGYTFPSGATLAPGARLVLTSADFTGKLSNGGENITLSAADGSIIQDFEYDDKAPWPEAPDGDGPSLTLIAPETAPDHSAPQNWRASIADGGSPGAGDATSFTGTTSDDLLVYGLGSLSAPVPTDIVPLAAAAGVGDYLVVEVPFNPAADDVVYEVLFSSDLDSWTPATADGFLGTTSIPNAEGLPVPHRIWRSPTPFTASDEARYAIVQLSLRP